MSRRTAGLGVLARREPGWFVTGDSKQGSQKQDYSTTTGNPHSALTKNMGNVAAPYAPLGSGKASLPSSPGAMSQTQVTASAPKSA